MSEILGYVLIFILTFFSACTMILWFWIDFILSIIKILKEKELSGNE